jgi:hypothetical protein
MSGWVPGVGDRVQIAGITGRPQLNGMFGAITGRASNGRMYVRLENIEAEVVSLKPNNLTGVSGGGGGGGSRPTGGGGGGVRGGSWQRMVGLARGKVERLRSDVRAMQGLPPIVSQTLDSITLPQLVGLGLLAVGGGCYYASRWVPLSVLGLLAVMAGGEGPSDVLRPAFT